MPGTREPSYGGRKPNRTSLIVTVLLHLLLVAIYLLQPKLKRPKPASEGASITYIAPLKQGKPTPKQREIKPSVAKPTPPRKTPARVPERVNVQRLPNTITLPDEKPVPLAKAEESTKSEPAPPTTDMNAMIEERRRQRGAATQTSPSTEESEDERANRIIRRNIASANNASREQGESESTVSTKNKSFSHLDMSIVGFNAKFNRPWLSTYSVELGNAVDIETAAVDKLIALHKAAGIQIINWQRPPQKPLKLSLRPEDLDATRASLLKELFPGYIKPR
ncbi:hypothetical protein [Massilia sp. S19_KUP03_FR1]|uniref:hypothetical protein n=1 Tax=Massilia sp. S19_KUP03_FR1 TaxID=3025503 RepID=UPI002FCDBE5F